LKYVHDIGAVIAARGGSVRVPNKNIKSFGDTNLLEHKINQLRELDGLSGIYVSSDCEKILNIADKSGACSMVRDPKYCTSEVSINEVYKNVVINVPHRHIMFIHITSPLITVSSLQKCIDAYNDTTLIGDGIYDSLATVTAMHKFMWKDGKPVNYDPNKMPRSQDLPNYYVLNFAVNILPRQDIIDGKNIIGKNFLPYYLDELESFDIDNQTEFDIAEKIYMSGISL
jgi:CMP-N,N'-diacetyllegionaminic acid synthase